MNVLVTGGAGFIGSHVTQLLCDLRYNVTVLDDLRFGDNKFVDPRAKFVKSSFANRSVLDTVLTRTDAVMHFAASSIIENSYKDPLGYFENNVSNGIVLLEAMRKNKVKKIIYSSSSSVYGQPKRLPVKETDPTEPITIYGSSKLAFEDLLKGYYHAFGIQSVSLRYYNAYGPHDEQLPRTRAIPMWIEAILKEKPIPRYWQGRQTRDYVFVKDIARAHIDVLSLRGCFIYNIGSGKGVLMSDVLKTLEKIVGKKLSTKDLGERRGDPMQVIADISLIKQAVGWRPRTSLQEGLRKTYQYYRKNFTKNK